jgi:L-alanine-DL-glutamate epimerase-like enolase superfamily enzyme
MEPVRFVRERCPDATIAIDANCAWGTSDLEGIAREAAQLRSEFLEQPFLPADDARLVPANLSLPLFADESCVTEDDVERVARHFDGFNIKLVKCGGITPARRMARRGRELGRKLMVGCMLETSVAIAAGAVIAQRTDYADLDGAWLLSDDPFSGWAFGRGVLLPPSGTGLGAAPGSDAM